MRKAPTDPIALILVLAWATFLSFVVFVIDVEAPQPLENEGETPCYPTPTKM